MKKIATAIATAMLAIMSAFVYHSTADASEYTRYWIHNPCTPFAEGCNEYRALLTFPKISINEDGLWASAYTPEDFDENGKLKFLTPELADHFYKELGHIVGSEMWSYFYDSGSRTHKTQYQFSDGHKELLDDFACRVVEFNGKEYIAYNGPKIISYWDHDLYEQIVPIIDMDKVHPDPLSMFSLYVPHIINNRLFVNSNYENSTKFDVCYVKDDATVAKNEWHCVTERDFRLAGANVGEGGLLGRWVYSNSDGNLADGWKKIGDSWYYFEHPYSDAVLCRFEQLKADRIEGNYWFDKYPSDDDLFQYSIAEVNHEGRDIYSAVPVMATGVRIIGAEWYAESADDRVYWRHTGGKTYVFDENGKMLENTTVTIDGVTYTLGKGGAATSVTDKDCWLNKDGKWYYKRDGKLLTGLAQVGSKSYFFNTSGEMQTGWIKTGGKLVDVYDDEGYMSWVLKGSKWYYFDKSGAMQTGWVNDGGKWYYTDETGAMKTGWVKVGKEWYYLDKSGAMQTGWVKVDKKWYYFNKSGAMQTGWIKSGGKWYYLDANGAMKTGWLSSNGKWYYFEKDGVMLANTTRTINGVKYNFSSDGAIK